MAQEPGLTKCFSPRCPSRGADQAVPASASPDSAEARTVVFVNLGPVELGTFLATCISSFASPTMKEQSGTKRKRSAIACTVCHDRKVCCNVAISGVPCGNCSLDGTQCRIYRRRPSM